MVSVYGCNSTHGMGNLHTGLGQIMLPRTCGLFQEKNCLFWQDNAKPHSVSIITVLLVKKNKIKRLGSLSVVLTNQSRSQENIIVFVQQEFHLVLFLLHTEYQSSYYIREWVNVNNRDVDDDTVFTLRVQPLGNLRSKQFHCKPTVFYPSS